MPEPVDSLSAGVGLAVPLCVDLDGTLLHTDTLLESLLLLLKSSPWSAVRLPFWLLSGRAHLKQEIAGRASLDLKSLPVNTGLLAYLRQQHESGRRLLLVSGTDIRIARAIAGQFDLFDEVCASDGQVNLSGKHKAQMLVERFGKGGFDYAGNAFVDLVVWTQARRAIVVSNSPRLVRKAGVLCEVENVFPPPPVDFRVWLQALRVHQWAKNLLVFVPLLGAHQWHDRSKLAAATLGFGVFSIGASSVYVLNDLFDLEADRHHPTKHRRPLASGQLPLLAGVISAPLLFLLGLLGALLLPPAFGLTFATYYVLTLLYSLRLKQVEILDVLTLAALYSIRVVAGGFATQVVVSDWLLVFSLFVFISLAFVKRFTELQLPRREKSEKIKGRGYQGGDGELISTMGVASGYLAVLVLALYISNPVVSQLYRYPAALWFACPVLLYWISRVWLLAHREALHDDPIVFALQDRPSWLVGIILLIIGAIAQPR